MRHELPQLLSLVCFPLGLLPALLTAAGSWSRGECPEQAQHHLVLPWMSLWGWGRDAGRKQEGHWALLTNALQGGAGTW